jgi:hypothetical protein
MLGLSLTPLGLDNFQLGGRVCGGEYQTDVQPSVLHLTVRCPAPRAPPFASRAGSHWHGIQPTLETRFEADR